jgi:hypothetical protein
VTGSDAAAGGALHRPPSGADYGASATNVQR